MKDIKVSNNEIIKLIKEGNLSLTKPFEREIFLFDTHIAGTGYIEGIKELEPHLEIDDYLEFFREPDNPFDKKAIAIKTKNKVKIGYVPKADNIIFSRLMDAGKLLFGRISKKEIIKNWIKINIKIYIKE